MKKVSDLLSRIVLVVPGILCLTGGLFLGHAQRVEAACSNKCTQHEGTWGSWSGCSGGNPNICHNTRGTDSCDTVTGALGYKCIAPSTDNSYAYVVCGTGCPGWNGEYHTSIAVLSLECPTC